MNPIIESVERSYQKNVQQIYGKEKESFIAGDTLRVTVKVKEGEKERMQAYEGVVISKKYNGLRENFTVRKISQGVGVERTFMLHAPNISEIKVLRRGRVVRAKLFYLRDRVGKKTRVKDKKSIIKAA
ncbi:MAG: 50S ribosomal protein L19 [Candidatus Riflebacteria bacterium]|nr:50S ribosomal protein L19 [Candidatus Riflebacteria bacterium]